MENNIQGGVSRRKLLKASIALMAASGAFFSLPKTLKAQLPQGKLATMIDLTLCDGCVGKDIPACVSACKTAKNHTIPHPEEPIPVPYPTNIVEDWSKKQDISDRLTPYNRIFIQPITLTHSGKETTLYIPRRCMHCDNPACATLCPFAANTKDQTGAVVIDQDLCFGGAKCRSVCPWKIPQRQSGVGLYLKVAKNFMGNGVMYKCDLCIDLLNEGKTPSCIDSCPRKAMLIGERNEIYAEAQRRVKAMGGYIFGKEENGGTATLYVSPIPFNAIDAQIVGKPGIPQLLVGVERKMAKSDGLAGAILAAPLLGLLAGVFAGVSGRKKSPSVASEGEKGEE
ncbi:MAG: 4Fe-4S dicluster domain-containing protein [Deltaproteobacteria bacterium]|nr:4Fe-4S dicluster domain-containing protein [Deltaproteobacteria bacterium]